MQYSSGNGGGADPDGSDDDDVAGGNEGGDWGNPGGGGGDGGGDDWKQNTNRPSIPAPSSDESEDTDVEGDDALPSPSSNGHAMLDPPLSAPLESLDHQGFAASSTSSSDHSEGSGEWSHSHPRARRRRSDPGTAPVTGTGQHSVQYSAQVPHPAQIRTVSHQPRQESGAENGVMSAQQRHPGGLPTGVGGAYVPPHALRGRDERPSSADPRGSSDSWVSRSNEQEFNRAHLAALSNAHAAAELTLVGTGMSMQGHRSAGYTPPLNRLPHHSTSSRPSDRSDNGPFSERSQPISNGTVSNSNGGGAMPSHTVLMPKLSSAPAGSAGPSQAAMEQLHGNTGGLSGPQCWNGQHLVPNSSGGMSAPPPPPPPSPGSHGRQREISSAAMLVHPSGVAGPRLGRGEGAAQYLQPTWHMPPPPPPQGRSPMWIGQGQAPYGSSPVGPHSLMHPPPPTPSAPSHAGG